MQTGEVVTNAQGGKQSFVPERYDLVPTESWRLLAQCLGFGADKYGEWNWLNISCDENINHAIRHLVEFLDGDESEPHLVNALARITFAVKKAIDEERMGRRYEREAESNTNLS